uniref:Uncharacterized protein n=1 Tax=Eptatretus burgeri TaxID=7764 RepID=A0A8C4NMK0_EPTBU
PPPPPPPPPHKSPLSLLSSPFARADESAFSLWSHLPSFLPHLSNSESSLMLDDQRQSQGLDERHGCQNSLQMKRRQLRASELRMEQAQQMMRQLVINIRMEKQLINQLVQTSMQINHISFTFQNTLFIAHNIHSAFGNCALGRGVMLYKMQCQQEECDHFTSLEMQSERHLHELENNLELMRRQYTVLEQKLWENAQHKLILDSEIHPHGVSLHMHAKHSGGGGGNYIISKSRVDFIIHPALLIYRGVNIECDQMCVQRFDGQQHWLDREVEKALEQRYELGELHQSMVQQEEELIRREALLQEMEQLRIKCNQSSQVCSEILRSHLLSLDECKASGNDTERTSGKTLEQNHLELLAQCAEVEMQLQKGNILFKEDEHYMLELHKAIEALDTTIACRNEVLGSRQTAPRDPTAVLCQSWDNIMGHLASLTIKETQHLLCKYFDKVVLLQEEKRYLELSSSLLEVKAEEREQLVAELQVAIQNLSLENERKLTVQQSEHECSLQLFMNDASTAHTLPESGKSEICAIMQSYEDKVQELQKELVFYKCTNRELKCKLQKTLPESRCSQRASTRLPGNCSSPTTPNIPLRLQNKGTQRANYN